MFLPLPPASTDEINKINNAIDVELTGLDCIPAKFVRMCADIIYSHLTNIINNDISQKHYSENTKTATIKKILKNDDRTQIKNYRPVRLLNIFSKPWKSFINSNLKNT